MSDFINKIREIEVNIYGKPANIEGSFTDPYMQGLEHEISINLSPLLRLLCEQVPTDGVVFDVGANVGLTAIMAGRHVQDGSVIAFEPSMAAYRFLERNIIRNNLKNVELMNVAVSDKEGTITFKDIPYASFASHVSCNEKAQRDNNGNNTTIKTTTTTVDNVVSEKNIARIDMIKIDVEGHETEVILGALQSLKQFKPIVFIEFNSWTTIAYGRRDPFDFLLFLQKQFPFVYEISQEFDRSLIPIDLTDHDAFVHRNLVQHGCVDDLVLSFRPLLVDRYALLVQNRGITSERDALIAERDALIAERGPLIAERDALVAERDALIIQRNALKTKLKKRRSHPLRNLLRFK